MVEQGGNINKQIEQKIQSTTVSNQCVITMETLNCLVFTLKSSAMPPPPPPLPQNPWGVEDDAGVGGFISACFFLLNPSRNL